MGLHPCGWLIHTHDKVHPSKGQCRACRQLLLPPSYLVSHTQTGKRSLHHPMTMSGEMKKMKREYKDDSKAVGVWKAR